VPPFISDSFGVPVVGEGPGPGSPPSFIARRSLRLGPPLRPAAIGTTGADRGKPCAEGRPRPPGSCRLFGIPPGIMGIPGMGDMGDAAPPSGEPIEPTEEPVEDVVSGGRGGARPIRDCWSARAFAMRSSGRLPTEGGGRLAWFSVLLSFALGGIFPPPCGSDTVRRDGTRRGGSALPRADGDGVAEWRKTPESALGGSSGVLASEDSSTEPGETGLLSRYSSGVSSSSPALSVGLWLAMALSRIAPTDDVVRSDFGEKSVQVIFQQSGIRSYYAGVEGSAPRWWGTPQILVETGRSYEDRLPGAWKQFVSSR
jgi:hypothetical protein